jgi:SWIM/SEC-C metal-binding protein
MSKFFYRGTPDIMGSHGSAGYQPNADVRLGSAAKPLTLVVGSKEREQEIEAIVTEHNLIANIEVNIEEKENIVELEAMLNFPKTQRFEKTPKRNDPCSCGSTKKYKKCCG